MKPQLRRFVKLLMLPFTWYFTKWFVDVVTRLDALAERMTEVEGNVTQEVETVVELLLITERQLARLNARLDLLTAQPPAGSGDEVMGLAPPLGRQPPV
ncbi:MAG: hypothetical protein ABR573_07315 [Candidatus Dormibacteria bacterium]